MSDPFNMVEVIQNLPCRPRGRACVVLTQDYRGQKDWAEELAKKTASEHVHLLDLFEQDEKLAGDLSRFAVPALFDFLKTRGNTPVLIVSGVEFLKATWAGQPNAAEQFASRMETWDNSPCLLFVMQYDKAIAERPFRRFRQHAFVIDQRETLKL